MLKKHLPKALFNKAQCLLNTGTLRLSFFKTSHLMKNVYSIILLSILTITSAFAQLGKNCCTPHELTSNASVTIDFIGGAGGFFDDVSSCSCLPTAENNSYWFKFDALGAGSIEFFIKPINGSSTANYDFALFEDYCPCDGNFGAGGGGGGGAGGGGGGAPPPVMTACNSADDGGGPTGAGDPKQVWAFTPPTTQFEPTIAVEGGKTYFLLIDNTTDGDGFTLDFSADTDIGHLPKPGPSPMVGPTNVCTGATANFEVPGGWLFEWTVSPPPAIPQNSADNFYEYTFTEPGTYEICASEFIDYCHKKDPTCLTVEVSDIPTATINDVFCYPGPYVTEDGFEIYSEGITEITYQSFLGCDSTVIYDLIGAQSNLEVRAELFCEGSCIVFEGDSVCAEGAYEKIYQNQFGCDSTIALTLIKIPLEINIVGVDTLRCNKPNITLNAGPSFVGGPATFIWENAAGDTLSMDSVFSVTTPGIYTVEVGTTVDGKTCKKEKSVTIVGDTAPPAGVYAVGGAVSCKESFVTLQGGADSLNVTYTWSGPNGFFSTDQNPTTTNIGVYTLTVMGENGCITTAMAEVIETIETIEAFATGGTMNCYSASVLLNGNTPAFGASYVWAGPNGTTYFGPTPSVSIAGNYTLTVTDLDGCTGTAMASVISDFADPTAVANTNQVLHCNAPAIMINGGGSSVGPTFNYAWAPAGNIVSGGNTLNPSVNAAGTYTLTVTNVANGCAKETQVQVTQLPEVGAAITGQTSVVCFGQNNGSASAIGSGGNDAFTYNWSNGMSGSSIGGLSQGNYIVTVTDGNNCTATSSVTINQPTAIATNATATPQTMASVNDGTASANPMGGTPGYSYSWSNGFTTQTINNLAPGNYTVTVTDENGCQSEETVTVNEIECFASADVISQNITCNGFGNGTATADIMNVTEPVGYIWSNDETTQTINNLTPGTYSVTATDANGCEIVTSVTITEPAGLNANATSTNQVVLGVNDGTATASPTGGTDPYSYIWSNGETTAMITDLAPDTYEVTVTDANGCESTQTVIVDGEECALELASDGSNATCNGAANGQATITPSNGIGPFTFEWSSGDSTAVVDNLPAGTYDVTVTDANECPAIVQVTIGEPTALTLGLADSTPAACGSDNGTASVMGDGGTPNYSYEWSNGAMTESVEDLAADTYTVTVTDDNMCETTLEVVIETDNTTDIVPPVVLTTDFTIELDADGMATITPNDIDNGSSDNCGISSMDLDISSFGCDNVGENMVELSVTDIGGNVVGGSAIVTVVDNIPPVINGCPDNMVLPFCNPVADFNLTVMDNCSANAPITQTSGLPSGSTFPEGETTIQTFEVMDAGGNTATCNFEITVGPTISATGEIEDVDCFGDENGSISVDVTGGNPDYTYLWSNDSTGVSINDLGPAIYSLTITDSDGCETIQEYEVMEPEDLTTTLVNIINEESGAMDGAVDVTVAGGTPPYTYQWTDLNGNVVGNTEDIDSLSAGTYQLFATDSNGCVVSSAYTIQTTSTNDPELNALIKIYPNPTSGQLTVEFIDLPMRDMDVAVYDVIGQRVFSQNKALITNGKYLLQMNDLPAGVYVVELMLEGEHRITRRIARVD